MTDRPDTAQRGVETDTLLPIVSDNWDFEVNDPTYRVPALRRRMRGVSAVFVVLMLGVIPGSFVGFRFGPELGLLLILGHVVIVAVVWGLVSNRVLKRQLFRAHELKGAMCIHCLYELPASMDNGTCPECGTAYSEKNNRIAWGLDTPPKRPVTSDIV